MKILVVGATGTYVAAIESAGTGQMVDFSADGRMRLDLLSRR